MTVLAELLACEEKALGYITYVFECLDEDVRKETRYIMCVRYPNWEHRKIEIGEVGFLNVERIKAGIDKWFDGNNMVPYKYDTIQFIKFIKRKEKKAHKFIMQINKINYMNIENYL